MKKLKGIQKAERLMHALPEEIQLYQTLLATLQEAVRGKPARTCLSEKKGIGKASLSQELPLFALPLFSSLQLLGEKKPNGKILPLPPRKKEEREVPLVFEGASISKEAFGTPKRRILSYQKFQLALREKETHSQEERR